MRVVPVLAGCALLGGCWSHRRTYVRCSEVLDHLPELRATGSAQTAAVERVEEPLVRASKEPQRTTHVRVAFDQRFEVAGTRRTLRELAAGCSDGAAPGAPDPDSAPCTLQLFHDEAFVVRDHIGPPSGRALVEGALLAVVLGGIGGGIYCARTCETNANIKGGVLIGGAAALALVWAIATGAHD